MSTKIGVFLLDDHEIVRRGVANLIDQEPDMHVVGEAGVAENAAHLIVASGARVALLDARLPDGRGMDVCRDVKSENPGIGCLILTSYDDDDAVLAAMLAGANGYLRKEVRASGIIEAIRTAAVGENIMDPVTVDGAMRRVREALDAANPLDDLTPREMDILALVAEGLSNREIAGRLYLAEKTVKNYVSGILSKLGMQRRTQAALFATEWMPKKS
ncbi:LuxR family two component transcriptional regulator [Microbacteriaceae bacterium MWH-Ta3]|nr:LuxR family two component transcriptional regulator [Microbacteriaceae bacterium MWH-Ta3]